MVPIEYDGDQKRINLQGKPQQGVPVSEFFGVRNLARHPRIMLARFHQSPFSLLAVMLGHTYRLTCIDEYALHAKI